MNEKDLNNVLRTPKDWNTIHGGDKASTLALSFIDMVARPINIPEDLLEKCIEAFNNNRGKFEWEVQAIQEVIDDSHSQSN